jgi:Putative amidoligase enzyme
MLNNVIRDKIEFAEYRLLYDSKMRLTDPTIQKAMQGYIQRLRQKYSKQSIIDALKQKAAQYDPHICDACGNPVKKVKKAIQCSNSKCKASKAINKVKKCGGWYQARILELEKAVLVAKVVPEEFKGTWRSIEFELIFKNADAEKRFISEVRCKRWAKHLHLKTDGSVKDERDRNAVPKEITFSYKSGDEQSVRELCALFKGKAYTNKTCGTHVHFDMRHLTDESTVRLYGQRLARSVPALRTTLPSGRRNSQYCREPISYFDASDRYTFVNLTAYRKHHTIEVRAHAGTLNANKILNWIRLCEIIMTSRVRSKADEVSSLEELIELYKLDNNMSKYLKKRRDKFVSDANQDEDTQDLEDTEACTAPLPPAFSLEPVEIRAGQ